MATFTHKTTALEDQAVTWYAQKENARTGDGKTAMEYAHERFQHWLDGIVSAFAATKNVDKVTLYNRIPDGHPDKAAIDAALERYR
jgi:hypothetical protein